MKSISPPFRISLCLVCIAVSVNFLAMAVGLVPDYYASRLESRKSFCENLAVYCSYAMQREETQAVKEIVQTSVHRNPEILSAGLRETGDNGLAGPLHVDLGNHEKAWDPQVASVETLDYVSIPIFQRSRRWGALELRFLPLQSSGLLGVLYHPVTRFYFFFTGICTVGFYFFIRLLLKQLNSTQGRVVPRRVRTTLDTLAEGVIVLDKEGQIVLANEAFAKTTGYSTTELEGQRVSDFAWSSPVIIKNSATPLPWEHSLTTKEPQANVVLTLYHNNQPSVMSVNSTPIIGDDGAIRGALVSFDNLTAIEEKNADLQRLLHKLKKSKLRIQHQNDDLKNLATKDPLTGCWNRRFFIEALNSHWAGHERDGRPLCCIMVDIDHFKSINDNHGHSTGDKVLLRISSLLQKLIRQADLICRYGGEEFCILLPGQSLDGALLTAERLRKKIEELRPVNLPVTVSLGVSTAGKGAKNMQELVDQADKALYVAKGTGRNKVQHWDESLAEKMLDAKGKNHQALTASGPQPGIPYPAVNVLLTTLSYRHPATADHCRRVADLCVATAAGILPHSEAYVLEMAALLHDIGKLGVPDAILLKPGALTPEEWRVIKSHEDIGEDLIAVAFSSKQLSEIICGHHYRFEGDPDRKSAPKGEDIPLAARILAIADAFDSMVSDQVYRTRRTREEAFQELNRHAGKQFDPHLVELFIQRVMERIQGSQDRPAPATTAVRGIPVTSSSAALEVIAHG